MGGTSVHSFLSLTELAIDMQVPSCCKIVPPPAQYALTTAGGEISPGNIGAQLKIYIFWKHSQKTGFGQRSSCVGSYGGGGGLC